MEDVFEIMDKDGTGIVDRIRQKLEVGMVFGVGNGLEKGCGWGLGLGLGLGQGLGKGMKWVWSQGQGGAWFGVGDGCGTEEGFGVENRIGARVVIGDRAENGIEMLKDGVGIGDELRL